MVYKICKKCGKRYDESPADPITFFCTNRCAKAFSNTPKLRRHKHELERKLFNASVNFDRLRGEEFSINTKYPDNPWNPKQEVQLF